MREKQSGQMLTKIINILEMFSYKNIYVSKVFTLWLLNKCTPKFATLNQIWGNCKGQECNF